VRHQRSRSPVFAISVVCLITLVQACGCSRTDRSAHDPLIMRQRALELNTEAGDLLPGRPHEAMKRLKQADTLAPGLSPVLNNMGICLLLEERCFDAALMFRRSAAADPRNPEPLYNLGMVFEKTEDWETAADYYEQALALQPENVQNMENLARVYVKLGRPRSEITPLAAKALKMEMRQEWVAWLSRYVDSQQDFVEDGGAVEGAPERSPARSTQETMK